MPTFTAIALDSLLEPGSRNPKPTPKPPPAPVRLHPISGSNPSSKAVPSRPPHAVSPILYATPDVKPLPDPPSSFPPSPYIVNHKRRGPRLLKSFSESNVADKNPTPADVEVRNASCGSEGDLKKVANGINLLNEVVVEKEETEKSAVALEADKDVELGDFLDFQETASMVSNSLVDERSWKPSSPMTVEFYDACEEISSDGSSRSTFRNVEDEMREMRLNLLMEIENRKQAEEALDTLQSQLQSLSQQLSLVGLTLPILPGVTDSSSEQPNFDPAEDLCRQVVIARAVAESIGRACSRAEIEMEMKPQIESKNFEIARLSDRLQYYEAANREMSQRNQEAVEMARQHRHRRKRRQRWIWGSIGLAVTLGAAAIAWSYIPASKPSAHEGESVTSSNSD